MSQRDVPPYMAFYPYDFLSDELVLAMTLEQVGAYWLLVCASWINGSIPDDIPALARILKRNTGEMEILWRGVGPCFSPHPTEPGRLVQKRVEEERAATMEAVRSAREKSRLWREKKKARTVTVPLQNGNVTVPSTLLSSYTTNTKKEESTKEAERAEILRSLYPAHRLDNLGAGLFVSDTPEKQEWMIERLRAAVYAPEWQKDAGKFVPLASNWIKAGCLVPAIPKPVAAEDTMAPETRRRLNERKQINGNRA